MYTHTHTHTLTHIYRNTHTYRNKHVIQKNVSTHTRTHLHLYKHREYTRIQKLTHKHAHAYTHKYTHTHHDIQWLKNHSEGRKLLTAKAITVTHARFYKHAACMHTNTHTHALTHSGNVKVKGPYVASIHYGFVVFTFCSRPCFSLISDVYLLLQLIPTVFISATRH